MVPITIVIQMTGLLLLSPSRSTGELPMYVLMPAPRALMAPHAPVIGFRASSASCRGTYDHAENVCYVDMDGWSMSIGTLPGTPAQASLPPGALNLTALTGRSVPSPLFAPHPDDPSLRGRVILNAGAPSNACDRFFFNVGPTVMSLTNVLEWRITDYNEPSLTLVRTPLGSGGGAEQTVATLTPVNGRIELFIRNLPAGSGPGGSAAVGDSATHFHAYYDLLGVPRADHVIPVVQSTSGPSASCGWAGSASAFGSPWINTPRDQLAVFVGIGQSILPVRSPFESPGAPTCLVAGGLPPP
ncbi:MAG: hypothetical protein ACJ8GN_04935 [Longimicrobiaceae bacterium]